jgi:hypothetical protein
MNVEEAACWHTFVRPGFSNNLIEITVGVAPQTVN